MAADYYEARAIKQIAPPNVKPASIDVVLGFTFIHNSRWSPDHAFRSVVNWSFIADEYHSTAPDWLTDDFVRQYFK